MKIKSITPKTWLMRALIHCKSKKGILTISCPLIICSCCHFLTVPLSLHHALAQRMSHSDFQMKNLWDFIHFKKAKYQRAHTHTNKQTKASQSSEQKAWATHKRAYIKKNRNRNNTGRDKNTKLNGKKKSVETME